MKHDNRVEKLQIAYIGGGSRGWAWGLMGDLALSAELSGTVKLYDIDKEAATRNEVIGNRLKERPEAVGRWDYQAVDTIEEALQGADFVIISIVPGTFEEMASDVHTPEKYGIYQSVGDTVGPGGIVRALRTIPIFAQIAEAVRAHCPDAWVINYTNPMTVCTRTLYEVFPEIKAFGCCHEVFEVQKLLADMLGDMKGITGVSREDIKTNVLGINHFTWIDRAEYEGMDLLPLYKEFVDKYYEEGFSKQKKEHWMNKFFDSAHRVKFDLFRRYGIIAAAGDRHLAEFCGKAYLASPGHIDAWKFALTPVSWRMENRVRLLEQSERMFRGEEELNLKKSGEEGVRQIKALLGLGDMVTNVNLPNIGQMAGLPLHSVVETNAVLSHNRIAPVTAGRLPLEVEALVLRHVANQETTLQAGLRKDADVAFRAFAADPLVAIDVQDARSLLGEMLQNTKAYLPGWKLD
ncbi:alpha-glucosidase/alpha-galactosidase [Paenibacillus tengchongensis]|uniref:family 4 glycosyl hydrolase n=1 Tax=Paenibacillus tengchongensis TaxID=2608684 RepID=UPI001C9E6855|nr:alpha-glucosidase/alpha-galactosidase [Paenibacillus tengchongensis]